jgi:hypothetical protein
MAQTYIGALAELLTRHWWSAVRLHKAYYIPIGLQCNVNFAAIFIHSYYVTTKMKKN